MISKKLLSEFSSLSKKEKQDFLHNSVLDGSLKKEQFVHLLTEYTLKHPTWPEITGDRW